MTYNAGERKDVRRAEKASKLVEAAASEAIRQIMSTTSGRTWMFTRLESAHIFATTFNPDPHLAAFAEGQRSEGLKLLADIMLYCPEQYVTMTQEANVRNTVSERPSSPNGNGRDQERVRDDDAIDDGNGGGSGYEAQSAADA